MVGTIMRVSKFMLDMRKRDLLLLGFVGMYGLLLASLLGFLPVPPLVKAASDHATIITQNKSLLQYGRLQLYLLRRICENGATTESQRSSCDREPIQDAIIGDSLDADDPLTSLFLEHNE